MLLFRSAATDALLLGSLPIRTLGGFILQLPLPFTNMASDPLSLTPFNRGLLFAVEIPNLVLVEPPDSPVLAGNCNFVVIEGMGTAERFIDDLTTEFADDGLHDDLVDVLVVVAVEDVELIQVTDPKVSRVLLEYLRMLFCLASMVDGSFLIVTA